VKRHRVDGVRTPIPYNDEQLAQIIAPGPTQGEQPWPDAQLLARDIPGRKTLSPQWIKCRATILVTVTDDVTLIVVDIHRKLHWLTRKIAGIDSPEGGGQFNYEGRNPWIGAAPTTTSRGLRPWLYTVPLGA